MRCRACFTTTFPNRVSAWPFRAFLVGEMTVLRLLSVHNLHWYGELVRGARDAIRDGTWPAFKARAVAQMEEGEPGQS